MKISIIVPNRNYAQYLPACLDSIAAQTYNNIEVLLADGKSDDGSQEIMEHYSRQYGWQIYSYSDTGQVDALNKGLEMATGDIQGWLNSDDILLSKRSLEKVAQSFNDYINLDIVSFGGYYLDKDGRYLRPTKLYFHPLFRQSDLGYRYGFLQPSTFWRKYVYDDLKLDPSFPYTFDCDFFVQASRKYNMLIDQNCYISGYRLHGMNLSVGVKHERIKELAKLDQKLVGSPFRTSHLNFLAFLVKTLSYLPERQRDILTKLIYFANNLLSYFTVYRSPSI
ncbi:MAG: glycosyltransferase [Aphanocapsa sp. GSE-SYN-MK-11-07L]|jgi:glycosyltransferase involved in cell wall biosynthesis|nr:glycosyltransferase [Aphanocapsa sp. GSE-SYN-MK-11-07L]